MEKIILSKHDIMCNFFNEYSGFNGDFLSMGKKEMEVYLTGDMFIGCTAAAVGLSESDFVEFALAKFSKKKKKA